MFLARAMVAPVLLVALSLQLAAGLPSTFNPNDDTDEGHSRIIKVGNCIGNRCAVSNLALGGPTHGSTDYSPMFKPWRRSTPGAETLLSKMVASKRQQHHHHHHHKKDKRGRIRLDKERLEELSEMVVAAFIYSLKKEPHTPTGLLESACGNRTMQLQFRKAACIVWNERRGIPIPRQYGDYRYGRYSRREAEGEEHPWMTNITRIVESCEPEGGLTTGNIPSWRRCICASSRDWDPEFSYYTDVFIMGPAAYYNLTEDVPTCQQVLSVTKREAPGTVPGHLMPSILAQYKMFGGRIIDK